jgi:thiol-disulfide isomerase/thioredoxin
VLPQFNQPAGSGAYAIRLLVVEVGFTFCQPCKKFAPFYKQCAQKYTDARFAYLNGNENAQTVKVLSIVDHPALDAIRDADPYYQAGVAQYELLCWNVVIGKENLDKL